MLIDTEVQTRWVKSNREWYENKGYVFTKYNGILLVKASDLTLSSDVRVIVECDYCTEKVDKQFKEYINSRKNSPIQKDCCTNCKHLKNKESNLLIYGVESTNQVKEVLDKRKETNLERYGTITPSANKDVIEKTKRTMQERYGGHYNQTEEGKLKYKEFATKKYGVENAFQSPEVKQKTKETNLIKYGAEHHTQSNEFQQKMKEQMLETYGVEHFAQLDSVKEKIRMTMYENGTVPTSKHQLYLWKILGGELNFPFKTSSIDIAFPEDKIGIEYDGSGHWLRIIHGHTTEEEFGIKEKNRNYGLYRGGWKIIRIISRSDKLPSDEIIKEMISIAKNHFSEGRSWVEFDIDEGMVKLSKFKREFNFGELRSYYSICKLVDEVV